jgi:Bacterial SH3 domain/Peptidase family M48
VRLPLSIVLAVMASLVALGGLPDGGQAQLVREHEVQTLRSFHGGVSRIRRSFQSDEEARNVLRQILVAAGLAGIEDRIILRASAETPNAEAYIEKDERFIFYNAVFMQELAKQTKEYWSMVAVLAHELGHHVRFHTVIPGRFHEFELEADYQAGFILRRLGGRLDQAQAAFRTFPEAASQTHPGRAQRLQAVTIGWTDGGARHPPSEKVGEEKTATINPPPRSPPARFFYVWDTRPPDDWLALRSQPSAQSGRQITRMKNGTLIDVLERRQDNWWRVRMVGTEEEGWVLSRQGDRVWIYCCRAQ